MLRIKDHADHGGWAVGIERLEEDDTLYAWDEKAGFRFDPATGQIFEKEWKSSTVVDHARGWSGSSRSLNETEGQRLYEIVGEYGHTDRMAIEAKDLEFLKNLI